MIFSSRPPPMILVISGEDSGEAYVRYLVKAGFRAASASRLAAGEIVERTLAAMPDMIVLDYDCDAETIVQLKTDKRTTGIPVIGLADFPMCLRPAASETLFPDTPSSVPQ